MYWLQRFRGWLLEPLGARIDDLVVRQLLLSREVQDILRKLRTPRLTVEDGSGSGVSHSEMVGMINDGRAMLKHQLTNREKEIVELKDVNRRLTIEWAGTKMELDQRLRNSFSEIDQLKREIQEERAAHLGAVKACRKGARPRTRKIQPKRKTKQ